jgi:hypothetical protein
VQWFRAGGRTPFSSTSYHSGEAPPTASRLAIPGAAGPYLGRLSQYWPTAAQRLAACFARPPLNRLSPVLIAVYAKT